MKKLELLNILNSKICKCTKCPELVANRTQTVMSSGNPTPSFYTRESGSPYKVNLRSNSKLYKELLASNNGIRQSEKAPKGFVEVG